MRRAGAAGTALTDGAGGGGGAGTERSGPAAPWTGVVSTAGPGLPRDFFASLSSLFHFYFPPLRRSLLPGRARSAASPTKLCNAGSRRCHPPCARSRPRGAPRTPPGTRGSPPLPRPGELCRRAGAAPGARRGRPGSLRSFLPSAFICGILPRARALPGLSCRVPPAGAPGRAPPPSRPGSRTVARSAAGALFFPFPLFNSYPFLIKTSPSARF